MKRKWYKKVPIVIGIAIAAAFVFGSVVMLLWNGILTPVLHVGLITFWQALGIIVLSKILFGGFRRRGPMGGQWKRQMWHRWNNMTPEEREKFGERMQHCRRGRWHRQDESAQTV